jgi:chromosome condensin MukBEF ATPase and DNA-binding subunit MukB
VPRPKGTLVEPRHVSHDQRVPRISAFYGIVITMYYRDHDPPHFHAVYGEHRAQIVIATLEPRCGELPARALRLVREWAELHRTELQANWAKARARQPLDTIPPLP